MLLDLFLFLTNAGFERRPEGNCSFRLTFPRTDILEHVIEESGCTTKDTGREQLLSSLTYLLALSGTPLANQVFLLIGDNPLPGGIERVLPPLKTLGVFSTAASLEAFQEFGLRDVYAVLINLPARGEKLNVYFRILQKLDTHIKEKAVVVFSCEDAIVFAEACAYLSELQFSCTYQRTFDRNYIESDTVPGLGAFGFGVFVGLMHHRSDGVSLTNCELAGAAGKRRDFAIDKSIFTNVSIRPNGSFLMKQFVNTKTHCFFRVQGDSWKNFFATTRTLHSRFFSGAFIGALIHDTNTQRLFAIMWGGQKAISTVAPAHPCWISGLTVVETVVYPDNSSLILDYSAIAKRFECPEFDLIFGFGGICGNIEVSGVLI
jgi:hypothetical protein